MLRGVGVDIVEIERIRGLAHSEGARFLEKVFTDGEIAYCTAKHDSALHFAARFAAKEAVSKALATGWSGEFRWKDVEVVNDTGGQPRIVLHGRLEQLLPATVILVSISHSASHAVAMAVIEGPPS
jgi:holo-[acyl-carrier protein] synthase